MGLQTGKSVDSTVRTSTGTFFAREQDQTIAAVEKRISMVRSAALCAAPWLARRRGLLRPCAAA